jgi:mRNA-degrading endonuclease toxin of MazEF toxin-antitoxin module
VISTDLFNDRTPVVVVAAITRQIKPWSDVAVTLPAGKPLRHRCQILVFQIMTVDKSRLRKYKGYLDPDQLEQLRKAMRATWEL